MRPTSLVTPFATPRPRTKSAMPHEGFLIMIQIRENYFFKRVLGSLDIPRVQRASLRTKKQHEGVGIESYS